MDEAFGKRQGIDFKVFNDVPEVEEQSLIRALLADFAEGDVCKPSLREMLYWMLHELFMETT